MKKILYIITQAEFGGAQRFIFNIATGLDKTKYRVVVAAGPQGDNQNGLLQSLEREKIHTARLKHLQRSFSPLAELKAFLEIRKLIKKEQPDVVQLGSSKAGIIGSLATKSVQKNGRPKIIYRIGGFAFNLSTWPAFKRKFYLWAEKIAQCCRDVVVVNSQYEKDLATKKNLPKTEKIKVIYNGLDLEKIKFLEKNTARNVLEGLIGNNISLEDKTIVGTVAHFYPAKDLTTLIQTAKEVIQKESNTCFIVIGDGPQRPEILDKIKQYGLQNSIFLPGAITPAIAHIKAFDIFAFSSVNEGSPWAILEAMAAGLPIISTDVAGIPEIIKNEKNAFLVPPSSPQKLAEKIIYLIKRPMVAARFSAQNLVDIENFTVEKMIAEFEKIY